MELFKVGFPNLSVDFFGSIPSTNQFLKYKAKSTLIPSLCIADIQTNGYGQRESHWESDQQSITFSLLLPINCPINQLQGFSQLLALRVKQSLAINTGHDYKVKWPNDIYMDDSKVAGLLVEVVNRTDHLCWLVIGLGVNTGSFEHQFSDYCAKGVPLSEGQNKYDLTFKLVQALLETADSYQPEKWVSDKSNWNNSDYFQIGELVNLKGWSFDKGLYLGVSDSGSLLIKTINNVSDQGTVELTSGMVSLRKKDRL
ncbi:MAG: biotin--[acetyl-CoA-carboxylase] ligase [Thiomicrospira sp.]|uniref:biotin--[acetyl-CoA-carboxylase] ligase n=1 Tax=Thiomicrospira sp. TaxID=935 RepID=UPI0019EDB5BB|nr:biotin--[acetyl-CoA-carboxylase] ligase [Thiomicrospira sp.]MBE0493197.1 biotin--[acetyl-CoA-carboxylase] ligase [Thiomicrospira sp.]